MKKHSRYFAPLFLLPILILALGLRVDDSVELEHFLSARTSANFTSSAKNIVDQLKIGTRGKISEIKKMPSGNYALKLLLSNGIYKGEAYWVYYTVNNPTIKIYSQNDQEMGTSDIKKAQQAQLTQDQAGFRDPEEKTFKETVQKVMPMIERGNVDQSLTALQLTDCKQEVKEVGPLTITDIGKTKQAPIPAVVALMDQALELEKSGKLEEAVSTLERALRIDKNNSDIYFKLAEINMHQGRSAEAEQLALKGLVSTAPNNMEKRSLWLLVAEARIRQNNNPGAIEAQNNAFAIPLN
ncbi:MAG: tetratricopeptide repeat protein [Bacteriovorax sp.]|nr:tetratricopeptide repeat protein [Bacteriovorax sp.]